MDILERAFQMVQAELGPEVFSDEKRLRLSLQLRQEEGGSRHYIGSAVAMDRAKRNAEIARDLKSGVSIPQVAERRGMSRQQVWNIAQDLHAASISVALNV